MDGAHIMDNAHISSPRRANYRWLIVAIGVAVGLALLVGLICWKYGFERDTAGRDLAATIDSKLAALNVKPRAFELTSEKAIRVRNAIKQDDFSTADKIASAVLANSHIENWRFHPFAEFISGIADLNDPAFEAHLNAWIARNNNDATPLLIRARYYLATGWIKRGAKFAAKTPKANLEAFARYMDLALADIEGAIHLDDRNPYGFYLRLKILRGYGLSNKTVDAFDAAIAKYPAYYPLYQIMLSVLEPKWGGNVPLMYAFVDRYAGHADEASPLKLLYVALYEDLLGSASTACSSYGRDNDKLSQCVASQMQKMVRPGLESNVENALQQYDHFDKYQFGAAMEPVFFDMLKIGGGGSYAGAFLELSANAMRSDTQLKERKTHHNDYIIDEAVAESWYLKGFYDNALQKDREALRDIEATLFPNEEAKDVAVAGVYQHMGTIYEKLHQYADVIAYEKASIALGNRTVPENFVCYAYDELKDYDAAIRACSTSMDSAKDVLPARYWRGVAYRAKGDADAALRDFTIVADSQSNFRTSAAIEMSMIYFGRGDNKGALNVLNGYGYLYDPDVSGRQDVAVSYNNRCYAYMQLGELKQALNDCTESLKYGNIPDAFRKQRELIKRLDAHEEGL